MAPGYFMHLCCHASRARVGARVGDSVSSVNVTFFHPRLGARTTAAPVHAVLDLAELDSYSATTLSSLYESKRDLNRSKGASVRRAPSRRLTTEISHAGGERMLHGMLHGLPCLPRAHAAAPIAQPCLSATEPNFYRPDRYLLDDRLTLSSRSSATTSSSASLPASEQKVIRKQGVHIALCHESMLLASVVDI